MKENREESLDLVELTLRVLESDGFKALVLQKPPKEQRRILKDLKKTTLNLEREMIRGIAGATLDREEASSHPHRETARLCRRGKYLDSELCDYFLEQKIPNPMKDLLRLYRPHIEEFGDQSLANLCLDGALFFDLTQGGIADGSFYDPERVWHFNTIEELCEALPRLSASSGIWLRRSKEHLHRLCNLFPHGYYYPNTRVRKPVVLEKLQTALANWDAIPEESQNPSVSI